MRSISAPMARQSKSKSPPERRIAGCRTQSRVTSRGPVERGRAKRYAADLGAAHVHLELEFQPAARRARSVLTPAPVRMRTISAAKPWRIRKAAAQRVPLPEISAALPSEL